MTAARTLQNAARLMRDRAKVATPSPWEHTGEMGSEWNDIVDHRGSNGIVADTDTNEENASYIASMHPDVGLALADWLQNTADCHQPEGVPGKEPYRCTTCGWGWPCDVQDDALAVARAYLGGAA